MRLLLRLKRVLGRIKQILEEKGRVGEQHRQRKNTKKSRFYMQKQKGSRL
jgi:hypothetical protein